MSDRAIELKRIGNRALAQRDYDGAQKAFRAAISEDSDAVEAYLGLAKVLDRTHDYRGIVDLIEPVVARFKSAGLLKALGDAYRILANRGEHAAVDPAITWYEAYLAVRRDAVTLYYLGELYREHRQDYEAALRFLKASWEHDPGSPTVYEAALEAAKKLGREDVVTQLEQMWEAHKSKDRPR